VELGNERAGDLFEPVVDATVEAIYNSLFRATTQQGAFARVEALPIAEVQRILAKYGIGTRR
jgi:D-aminopeptidase